MDSPPACCDQDEEVRKREPATRPGLDLDYWICLRAGVECKTAPDLGVVVFLLKNLEGRDKITKVIQYGARYLMWYYLTQDKDSAVGSRYGIMFKAAQSARKCFHLCKTLEEADKLRALLKDKKLPPWRRHALMLRAASMMVYWVYDNTVFLAGLKLSDYDVRTASTRNGAAWSLASAISMVLALHDLNELRKKRAQHEFQLSLVRDRTEEQTPEKRSALEELVRKERLEHFTLLSEFIKSMCDFLVAANANGFDLPLRVTGQKLNDGVIGLAGLTSAVLAIWKVYPTRKMG